MKLFANIFFTCAVIFFSIRLYANTPDGNDGRILFELKYGQSPYYGDYDMGQFSTGFFSNRNNAGSIYDYIGSYTFHNGSNEEKLRNYYLGTKTGHGKLANNEYEFLLDYFLTSRNSIGISANSNNIRANNLAYSNSIFTDIYFINYAAGNILKVSPADTSLLEGLFPYYRENNVPVTIINTFNIFYSYHFLDSQSFDPYIRIGLGYGKETTFNGIIHKGFLSLGFRYFLINNAYLSVEATGTNYNDFYRDKISGHFKYDQEYDWDLNDLGFKIGIGYRI